MSAIDHFNLLLFLLQDSFSKSSSSATVPTANNSSGVPNLNHAAVAPGGGGGGGGSSAGGGNFNKASGSDNHLSGYSAYNNYNKAGGYGNSYQYQQYPNSNSFSSQQQQGSGGSAAAGGSSSQYKAGAGQYDKYDPQLSNPAAAVLGLANTNTTNALSGKVSATTASMS